MAFAVRSGKRERNPNFRFLTWDEARQLLLERDKRKLYNNTWLERLTIKQDGYDVFGIILHNTVIVRINPDGTYRLNTGNWYTVTTKDRLHTFSPARIYSKRGEWFITRTIKEPVYDDDTYQMIEKGQYEQWKFFDGVIVDKEGRVINSEEGEE